MFPLRRLLPNRRHAGRGLARRAGMTTSIVIAILIATTGAAWAYWATTGSGNGSATTGTLNAPAIGAVTANGSTVTVNWSAPSDGATPGGYYITRTVVGGASNAACGTSPTSLTSTNARSCTDSNVPSGNYTYSVTAVLNTWSARSGQSNQVTVNNATKLAITSTALSGAASSTANLGPITVTVENAAGTAVNASAAVQVDLSSSSTTTGVFSATSGGSAVTSVTIAAGSSSTSFYYGDKTAGSPVITVADHSGKLQSATQTETVTAGPVASLTATAGTPQSATVGTAFATNLAAVVKDTFGNVISGAQVVFTAPSTGASGTFTNGTATTTATTNVSGVATATTFTANYTTGTYTVTAAAGGKSAGFSLTNNAGPAPTFGSINVSQIPQGASKSVTITGTNFEPGATLSFNMAGVSAGPTTVTANGTQITVVITVAQASSTTTTGKVNLTITNPDNGSITKGNAFSVTTGPTVTSFSPSSLPHGTTNTTVTISGQNFSGSTVTFSNASITATVSTVTSGSISAKVTVPSSVPPGKYDVIVTNGDGGSYTLVQGLTVT